MLGARLARRIVLPLVFLIGGLFALLAVAAVQIADARVFHELEDKADRVAGTLDGLPVAAATRPEILQALAQLVGAELVVDGYATSPWEEAELAGLGEGSVTLAARDYVVLERRFGPGGKRCFLLVDEERVSRRRRDVLLPVAMTGALGLLVALVLGLVVARTIARPVRDLADSVKGFAAGRFDGDIGARGPGEIGELQEAFVRMVGAIREGEKRLRESERLAALGRLAGGIAHELRNPLTAIRMAVETASVGGDTEGRLEARRIALAEIERLDRTLRELLDFVRPREPRLAEVNIRALFTDVLALLRPQCDHLKVRLEMEAPDDLTVRADPDRLKQAVLNLVLNGAQAQPRGGVVRLRAGADGIEVEDQGPGIREEIKDSLLQPFVTTKAAGIGLGLAVVAQVAEEHGAELDFRTGADGTTFRLRFS
ncbi:MAG: ATP-binding protein [Planctomycetota bacterium]